jgi:subtilisin family serine protease
MRTCVGLALLITLAVLVSLLDARSMTAEGPSTDQTKVRPEVADALEQRPEVAVIISLSEGGAPLGPPDVPALVQNATARQERVLSALTPSDFTLTRQYQAVPALAGRITASGAQKLADHPDVTSIGSDGEVHASLGESIPLINAHIVLYSFGISGEGIEVAVLDTGIDTDHPDFWSGLLSENCFLSGDIPCHNGQATDSGPGSAEDDGGHGSRVSGVITSNGWVAAMGVAQRAGIRAYKVLDSTGSGSFSDVLAALDHIIVTYPDTHLINMSLGDGISHAGNCNVLIPAMTIAINTLKAGGTTTVASSGNYGFKTGMNYPACIPAVVSVGMTYDATFGTQAWPGVPCTDTPATVDTVPCASNSGPWLDLLAPGAQITSSNMGGGTATKSGTSYAAPHVVGVAALVLEHDPTLTPDQLEFCLKSSGVPITDPGNGLTRPRVDALAALSCPGGVFSYALDSPNPQAWAAFGASVAVGDVNGDGAADIAVGAPFEHVGGNDEQGRAYVFSGADSSLLLTLDIPNPQANAWFGGVTVGDVNADGKGDIAVGAYKEDVGGNTDQGRAYVFSGADGSLLFTLDIPSPQASAFFGQSPAVGDVNGDGKGDIAVGAGSEDVGENTNQGRAYVFSGADGSLLLTLDSPNPQALANFGASVAVGDVNGDGKEDIAVGAYKEDVAGNIDQGRAYVFSGADGSLLLTLDSPNPQANAWFGAPVAVGDVNDDGKVDIAAGAYSEDVGGNTWQGRAYVLSGADGSLLFTLDTPNPQEYASFGAWVAVGDVNGDGKGDIAVGALGEDVDMFADQGRAYVFSGADSSLLFALDTLDPQDYANFGGSLAVGDVNADGRPDIVAGAIRGASVYVFPSEPGPSTPTPTPAAVGGVAELPGVSDSSDRDYIALAGLAALALVAFTAGAWYARRQ